MEEWRYYRHALLSNKAPHCDVNPKSIVWNKKKWSGIPFFARWTSDFDCKNDTGWWYSIKDEPFDYKQVSSNYRTKIRKSLLNCEVKVINPQEYVEELTNVTIQALEGYKGQYKPISSEERIKSNFINYKKSDINREYLAVFHRETNELCGYGIYGLYDTYVDQEVVKVLPEFLKYGVNSALVFTALERYLVKDGKYKYVCNGEKNLVHDTNYPQYLEKNFAFRKVYCVLNIKYRPGLKILVNILYLMRKLLKKLNNNRLVFQINAVLEMEEICRKSRKKNQRGI